MAEMDNDVQTCTKRNVHKRSEEEITELANKWEKTPAHYLRLDVRSLLQAEAIDEVEMTDVVDEDVDLVVQTEDDKPDDDEEEETSEVRKRSTIHLY